MDFKILGFGRCSPSFALPPPGARQGLLVAIQHQLPVAPGDTGQKRLCCPPRREHLGNRLLIVQPPATQWNGRLKKPNSCDYVECDFGSLTNGFQAAGPGSMKNLLQEHKANKTNPQHGA